MRLRKTMFCTNEHNTKCGRVKGRRFFSAVFSEAGWGGDWGRERRRACAWGGGKGRFRGRGEKRTRFRVERVTASVGSWAWVQRSHARLAVDALAMRVWGAIMRRPATLPRTRHACGRGGNKNAGGGQGNRGGGRSVESKGQRHAGGEKGDAGNEGRRREGAAEAPGARLPYFGGAAEKPEGREDRQRRQRGKGAEGRGVSIAYGTLEKVSGLLGVWFQDSCIFFLFSGEGGVFHHLPALPAIGSDADPESVKIRGKSVFRRLEGVRVLVLKGARVRPAEGGRKSPCAIFPVIPTWCRIGI